MIIANPIYDTVFKYLLNDNQVAKVLISNILDIKVHALKLEPTEITLPKDALSDFTICRIDFKATITLENNENQVILIEIQKAKLESDIIRFRKYLGSQYMDPNNNALEKPNKAYPIYTIYFLGKTLANNTSSPIINVNREYIDNYTKEKLTEKEEFIESLTHNSVVIQIPLLKIFRRNRLEKLLSIFEASTNHEIEVDEVEEEDYKLITRRLVAANSDKKVRQQMDLEDEILLELANKDRFKAQARVQIEESKAREEEAKAIAEESKKREEDAKAREVEANQRVDTFLKNQKNTINRLRAMGLPDEEIAEMLGLSIAELLLF